MPCPDGVVVDMQLVCMWQRWQTIRWGSIPREAFSRRDLTGSTKYSGTVVTAYCVLRILIQILPDQPIYVTALPTLPTMYLGCFGYPLSLTVSVHCSLTWWG